MSDLQVRGSIIGNAGAPVPFTAGYDGASRIMDAHGRFMDAALGSRLFTFGLSNTALVAANAIATGLTSSAQPIVGVYNPMTNDKNLVILQATLINSTIANSAVSPGGFMWVYSANNGGVSTGSNPINCKTLQSPGGSSAKAFAISTALTGLSNNLAALRAAQFAPLNAAGAATAASIIQGNTVENVDGGIVVPPGGVVGIMGQVSTTTISMSVGLLWEEVPITL